MHPFAKNGFLKMVMRSLRGFGYNREEKLYSLLEKGSPVCRRRKTRRYMKDWVLPRHRVAEVRSKVLKRQDSYL